MSAGGATASRGREAVAIILAVGIAVAINLITIAVLYDAIFSNESGLSENATQVITTAFGGMIGVLGSYIGFRAGASQQLTEDIGVMRNEVTEQQRPPAPTAAQSVDSTTEGTA
jgi:predicted small secreted protein